MSIYPTPINDLIEQFSRLPGIGGKSAQRLAFHIIDMPYEKAKDLSESILRAKENIKYCNNCCTLTDDELCSVCKDAKRDKNTIMVVEDSRDMAAYERINEFKGQYHILHGTISPLNGITPDDLKIKELLKRITNDTKEIIIATNPNVEGEATAMYLSRLLSNFDVLVTRIAHGVPVGGDLEYVDEVTLSRALEGRRKI